jgi:AraC-like DNA-binding protein
MSRSAFALKFKELLGETPLDYLTNWRMYKATRMLQEDDKKLFEVARSVGYDSDEAFSKAFKRALGVAPREYRRTAAERNEVEVPEPHAVGASSKASSTARNRTRGV